MGRYRFVLRGVEDTPRSGGLVELPSFEMIHLFRAGPDCDVLAAVNTVEWVEQEQLPVWVPAYAAEEYRAAHPATVFTCPDCGMTSFNRNDLDAGYCGACHAFTGYEHEVRVGG